MTIALNMIVGPYEEPFLAAALASVLDLCDEIVFVDTSPGNNPNIGIMRMFGRVIEMPRGEDKDFSFAAARELARVNTKSEWVLRLDADEVLHESTIAILKKATEDIRYSTVEIAFYHFMVYPWLYQYIEPKRILFRKDNFSWINGVHEIPITVGRTLKRHDILFYHYGYCRGQEEVFKRWQLYVEIDGRPTWYSGTNPATILSDRISVCQNFTGEHPKVVQGVLADLFKDVIPFQIRAIPRYSMTDRYVGLLLLTHNDEWNLKPMLSSLEETLDYPTVILHIDMDSTDTSAALVENWSALCKNNNLKECITLRWDKLYSLSSTQNYGFKHLMSRQECDLIGWIHPDMLYAPGWLSELVATLQTHSEIGKICAYNTREGSPNVTEIFEGHEQAYLIKRGILLQIGLFDEKFIGIGGYEDWDMNNRIRREGLKVAITPKSLVWHKGMATRERRDTTAEQIHNRGLYVQKWGTASEWIDFA
jgi:GT2 family glycosyltransferase